MNNGEINDHHNHHIVYKSQKRQCFERCI